MYKLIIALVAVAIFAAPVVQEASNLLDSVQQTLSFTINPMER